MTLPVVGVTSCIHDDKSTGDGTDGGIYYKVGDKYMRAMMESAGALPVLLPAFGKQLDIEAVLDSVHGLLFTGSPSNVHPENYGERANEKAEPYDEMRDETTLPLLKAAIERGTPVMCICRGFQELNVVMGGTLYPRVHEVEGRFDHRRPEGTTDVQYGPHHDIEVMKGGMLESMIRSAGLADIPKVNSLHWQSVKDLGPGLKVEARASDGTVEAVSLENPNGFLFAVQWHPEYRSTENPLSTAIFNAFGEALRPEGSVILSGT